MEALIIYEVKVAVYIAIFYAFYRLLLSKETLHRLNRIVLIVTAILSFVLPFCVITVTKDVDLAQLMVNGSGVLDMGTTPQEAQAAEWWWIALAIVYGLGILACLIKTGVSVLGVFNLFRKGETAYTEEGYKLCIIEDSIAPCSWMNTIILSREDYEENYEGVMSHEKAHIDLGHSKDVLVVDLLTAFQWFNPMMWMPRADLRAVHEFEADDAVLCKGVNIKEYLHLLIKKSH